MNRGVNESRRVATGYEVPPLVASVLFSLLFLAALTCLTQHLRIATILPTRDRKKQAPTLLETILTKMTDKE
jgi:hypothetical protein